MKQYVNKVIPWVLPLTVLCGFLPAHAQEETKALSETEQLQTCLVEGGYLLPQFGVDGDFGLETRTQLERFVLDHSLEVNTEVVDATLVEKVCESEDENLSDLVTDDLSARTLEIETPLDKETELRTEEEIKEGSNTNAEFLVDDETKEVHKETLVFSFKMNLTPFEDPLYLPNAAPEAVTVRLFNKNGEELIHAPQTLSIISDAEVVVGQDGKEYYKITQKEALTFVSRMYPSPGTYYAELAQVSFTSQDVTKPGFTGYTGVKFNLNPEQWTTDAVVVVE